MFEWEEADRFSFEDSDRFEEDSICSWISEPESVVNNWRGWRKNPAGNYSTFQNANAATGGPVFVRRQQSEDKGVMSLTELASREVATSIPFELVEHYYPPVPEELQLRIAFWSFPEQEEDIRLYSCLANGSADEFVKGEHMLKIRAVKEPLQIGFHLSATVAPGSDKQSQSTSVTFDRRKIVSCQCSCNSTADWCSHVVALCLHRIHHPSSVTLRAPVSESLSRLERDQLQKFAQYLIAELPQQILPTAQRILDELLSPGPSAINSVCGAPDPTAGGAASEQTSWCLDGKNLKDNIKKILIKFCVPAPIVFSDVNYLSTTAPPSAAEWCSFLRPLRGREPEGMWNLLSIVREMFRRNDRNSIPLLEIITQQCLETAQIMVWWFNTKVALHHRGSTGKQVNSNSQASQNACASLCDEIVTLWKLAALNPCMSPQERHLLRQRLMGYHVAVIKKIQANQSTSSNSASVTSRNNGSSRNGKPSDLEVFSGFKSAIEACTLDWSNDPIDGITFGHNSHYLCPFAIFKLKEGCEQSQVNSSQAVLRCEYPGRPRSVDFGGGGKPVSREPVSRQDSGNVDGVSASQQPNSFSSSEEGISDEGVGDESVQPGLANQFESGNEDEDEEEIGAAANPNPALQEFEASANPEAHKGQQLQQQHADIEENQYQVYFYDSKEMASALQGSGASGSSTLSRIDIFRKLRSKIDDDFEINLMRAEGVHAHGFHAAACDLAVELANKMIQNPPNLLPPLEVGPQPIKGKRKKGSVSAASHALTHKTSTTLSHCSFLCTVLTENANHHHLAFQIGMFGLELARPPASTKPMEVKLAHQESELVSLLKRIPLGPQELAILRDRAIQLREGTLRSRGEALLPLMLASYIFESLVITQTGLNKRPTDEILGFEAAVAAIGLKAHVSEAEHPLLCEGTRRQRGDLALLLLVHYKDQPERVAKIMDRLLDKEIHQLFKSPILPSYYVSNPVRGNNNINNNNNNNNINLNQPDQHPAVELEQQFGVLALNPIPVPNGGAVPRRPPGSPPDVVQGRGIGVGAKWKDWESYQRGDEVHSMAQPPPPTGGPPIIPGGNRLQASQDPTENVFWQRSVDTPSSDVSMPISQPITGEIARGRHFALHNVHRGGPGSDSGSSGNSSADSIDSSSSSNRHVACNGAPAVQGRLNPPTPADPSEAAGAPSQQIYPCNFPPVPASPAGAVANMSTAVSSASSTGISPQVPITSVNEMSNLVRTTLPNIKVTRFKGKRAYPSLPNQPSEASAHFMFELAKQVLTKAGGNSSTSLFTAQPSTTQNPRGPHRALHMCAFQIGLYALGLHNRVSPNWLSRTYSSHVSWITGQAMEIGAAAISFLVDTWEGHLTPPEAASMADKASKSRDVAMVVAAAELALSVLPHAGALNPNEIQRAIQQCKEQCHVMLEKACLAVEKAATSGGVYPEVMFEVARHWHHLFEKHAPTSTNEASQDDHGVQHEQLLAANQGGPNAAMVAAAAALGLAPPNSSGGHNFQGPPPPLQLPFPVYGLIPGFSHGQNGAAAAAALGHPHQIPLQMYAVAPPPTAAAAAALHLQGLAAAAVANSNGNSLQMFPPTSTANHFNLAGGPLYQFGTTGIQLAPLLPNPPATQAQLQAAAVVHQAHAAAAANHSAVTAALFGAASVQHQMPFHAGVIHHPSQHHHVVDHHHHGGANVPPPLPHGPHQHPQHHSGQQARHQAAAQRYLVASYRVGMLALENLGRRISEDRPLMKFARNPSYGDDVKWLLSISRKLGPHHIQNFLMGVVNTVVSPFLLQDLAYECGKYLALSQSFPPVGNVSYNAIVHQIRSQHHLTQLVNRCYQTYYQCIHQRLYHVTPADYDDFVAIIVHAKRAFQWTAEGLTAFQQLLQSIRRSKCCKKELWQKILSSNNNNSNTVESQH